MAGTLQERANELGKTSFLGCPVPEFESGGRRLLSRLLDEGLTPSSRLLDVGCGALRLGYWAMRLLDPGHYYGIEPNVAMREMGLGMIEQEVVERARPTFSENEDFDFSVFGEQFDFVFAASVWTHASREQIGAMLASFAACASPSGAFITSYRPASRTWEHMRVRYPEAAQQIASRLPLPQLTPLIARLPAKEDPGTDWVGRSHLSSTKGLNWYSVGWIAGEASKHGLRTQLLPYRVGPIHQWWLKLQRAT